MRKATLLGGILLLVACTYLSFLFGGPFGATIWLYFAVFLTVEVLYYSRTNLSLYPKLRLPVLVRHLTPKT